ncbi:MAG: capsular polysaccharide biosynthesis protein [Pseudomonadota bacterium]
MAQAGLIAGRQAARVLSAAGWVLGNAAIRAEGHVHLAVWGRRRAAIPGLRAAALMGRPVLTLEDGYLRGIRPPPRRGFRWHREAHRSPSACPPLSMMLDDRGIALDAAAPSRLEALIAALSAGPLPEALAERADAGLARLRRLGLSKYTPFARAALRLPRPGYVLVIDQLRGDASVALGGAGPASFAAMLAAARVENQGARIVVKSHPAAAGRQGHYTAADLRPGETLLTEAVNPWDLVEGAARVYAVSSQLGYEALLAGHETRLFGLPFYAGWGLTSDQLSLPRFATARAARPTRLALFAATHLLGPLYWSPYDQRLASFEETLDCLEALAAAGQGDHASGRALTSAQYGGFSPWKRRHLARFGPHYADGARHHGDPARAITAGRRAMRGALASSSEGGTSPPRVWLWASRTAPDQLARGHAAGVPAGMVEDGFLRSVGLGARLTDAASLVFDDLGIHYDPARSSRLEKLIEEAAAFDIADPRLARAAALVACIRAAGVTKYNLDRLAPAAPTLRVPAGAGERRQLVLVPGQVADDASVRLGTAGAEVTTNLALLRAARAACPDAFIVYKPHPDVEAGLRFGAIPSAEAGKLADLVARQTPAAWLLERADAVWTMTSLMGFEALLRGIPVTCLGAPFYAGWGLTTDRGPVPTRRQARPTLEALAWAALIAYPRYVDPLSGLPAPPEIVLARLAAGTPPGRGGLVRKAVAAGQDGLARLGLVRWR